MYVYVCYYVHLLHLAAGFAGYASTERQSSWRGKRVHINCVTCVCHRIVLFFRRCTETSVQRTEESNRDVKRSDSIADDPAPGWDVSGPSERPVRRTDGVVTICSVIDSCADRRFQRRVNLSNELQRYCPAGVSRTGVARALGPIHAVLYPTSGRC